MTLKNYGLIAWCSCYIANHPFFCIARNYPLYQDHTLFSFPRLLFLFESTTLHGSVVSVARLLLSLCLVPRDCIPAIEFKLLRLPPVAKEQRLPWKLSPARHDDFHEPIEWNVRSTGAIVSPALLMNEAQNGTTLSSLISDREFRGAIKLRFM